MKFPAYTGFLKLIPAEWRELLKEEVPPGYYRRLHEFLRNEYSAGNVYPPAHRIFRAFELTPPGSVKVVIIGQDPYHGAGEADGLAFSSSNRGKLPPSLKNIFKELESDTGTALSGGGDLSCWAAQGVLLLNTFLTVREDTPASHQNSGWEIFTDAAIKAVSSSMSGVVFMLWGNHARNKHGLIDSSKHLILEASHPSPFSAGRGFFGCRHFSGANEYLELNNRNPVNWSC